MAIETETRPAARIEPVKGLRRADWRAALMAGLGAGIAAMGLEILLEWAFLGQSGWAPVRWMAGLSYDRGAMPAQGILPTIVAAAVIYSGCLCVEYAALLADFIHPLRSRALAVGIGVLFGLALYGINIYGLSYTFPWFVAARNWATLVVHAFFGGLAGYLYAALAWKTALR